MNITIRRALPADAADMAEILSRSWEAAYKNIIPAEYISEKNATRLALFRRIVTGEDTGHCVIEKGGKSIGIMWVGTPKQESHVDTDDIDDSFYELHSLYIHPDFWRQGIGSEAMEFAVSRARSAGKRNIILWVFAENTGAISFYEKCGFTADGAYKLYNCGRELKAIRMRLAL